MEKIAILKDDILGVNFTLCKVNSKDLSDNLKSLLSSKSVDYNKFNSDKICVSMFLDGKGDELPLEAYEYQNFFLLEKDNGDLILLDGFRRLLWNETVNHPILVRVYKESDMNNLSLLKLLVGLNHTKFFGGIGNFYDRGFALCMFMLFNVDITKIYKSFNGYLTLKEARYSYSVSRHQRSSAALSTLEKVSNVNFIEDMKFLEKVSEYNIIDCDEVFGAFVSDIRANNSDVVLIAEDFIEKIKNNPILFKQIESFKKAKDSRGNDIGNKMFEMFSIILLNKEGVKSFIEREAEIKEVIATLKKDKSWFCYTNCKKLRNEEFWTHDKEGKGHNAKGINQYLREYFTEHSKYPKMKVVVLPSERNEFIEEGVIDDFEMIGFETKKHLIKVWHIPVIKRGDTKITGKDNHYDLSIISDGNYGYNKKSNNIYLFIENIFQ